MVDSHVCKTPNELAKHDGEMDMGIGIDNIPEEARKKKIGSGSKANMTSINKRVDYDKLDKPIKKLFNPKNKDDPFRTENWSF